MFAISEKTKSIPFLVSIALLLFCLFFPIEDGEALDAADSIVAQKKQELTFLTWSNYIDPEVVKEFEEKHNVKVKEVYFETDDLRDDMLLTTNGTGFDLVITSSDALPLYMRQRWLAPLGEKNIPNLRHIDPRWRKAFSAAENYTAPYFWGTTGIAYRKDMVKEEITSWKQLFQPAENLRGKLIMIKTSRDLIGMALKCLGYSANSTENKELAAAEQLLINQKAYVKAYSYVSTEKNCVLVTGDAAMAMIYNGDALMLKKYQPEIAYTVPVEGGSIWVDYLVVLEASANKKLAMQFINFLNEPHNAARIALYVYYATANTAAEKMLPPDFLSDPAIYPSKEVIAKCELYTGLPIEAIKIRNAIFSKITDTSH